MSTTREMEPLRAWLSLGPTELPLETQEAILSATRSMPQAGAAGRTAWRRHRVTRPSRTQLLGLAAVVALTALLGTVAIGIQSPDRTEEQPRPTGDVITSDLYGYRITPQDGAVARMATEPWDGVGTWDGSPTADRFSGDGHLFTVAAVDVEPGMTARSFIDAHHLDRPREFHPTLRLHADLTGYCQRGAMMIPGLTADRLKWNADEVAGLDAQIRAACGHVDAVVVAGGKAWALHSASQAGLGADIEAFHRVADTMVFPSAIPEAPRSTYTSDVYGYRITPRYDAVPRLATARWDGSGAWDRAPTADRFMSPGQKFTVVSVEVPRETTVESVTESLGMDKRRFPLPPDAGPCRSRGSQGVLPRADLRWVEHPIAGRSGLIRAVCGYVDAVVIVDGRAWVMSSLTSRRPGGNVEAFDEVANTIEFP